MISSKMSKPSEDKVPPKRNDGSGTIQHNKRYKVKSKTDIRIGVEGSASDVLVYLDQPNFIDKSQIQKSIKTDGRNQMVKYDRQQNLKTNFDESKDQPIKTSSTSLLREEDVESWSTASSNEEYQFSYPGILTLVTNSDQTESKKSGSTNEEQSHFLEDYQVGLSDNEEDTSNTVDEMDQHMTNDFDINKDDVEKSNIFHSDEKMPTNIIDEMVQPMTDFDINKDEGEKSNIFHSDEQMPISNTVNEMVQPISDFDINKDDKKKSKIFHSNEKMPTNIVDEMVQPMTDFDINKDDEEKSDIFQSDEQISTSNTVDEMDGPLTDFDTNKDDGEKSNIFDPYNTQSSESDRKQELVEANSDGSTTNLTSDLVTNDDPSRSEMPPPTRRNLIEQSWLLALFLSVIGLLLLALGLSTYMWYITSIKEVPTSIPEHQSTNIIDMTPKPAEPVSTQSDVSSMPEHQSQDSTQCDLLSMPEHQSQDSTDISQMLEEVSQLVSIKDQRLFVVLLWLIPLLQVIILASDFCCCCNHRQNLRGLLMASFACFMIGVIILVT